MATMRQNRMCGATNRRGLPCQCKKLYQGGRCKFHGGLSTGPKTPEGKVRVTENLNRYWAKRRAEGACVLSEATKQKISASLRRMWQRRKMDAEFARLGIS